MLVTRKLPSAKNGLGIIGQGSDRLCQIVQDCPIDYSQPVLWSLFRGFPSFFTTDLVCQLKFPTGNLKRELPIRLKG